MATYRKKDENTLEVTTQRTDVIEESREQINNEIEHLEFDVINIRKRLLVLGRKLVILDS